eukprot:GEMP01026321.1.p1 GENE.GEMP01026321.1~~GEMP01026321.1.p1  ORF type:complete len:559 (+),score=116.31 GEMP01026321.1:379-2055(+)
MGLLRFLESVHIATDSSATSVDRFVQPPKETPPVSPAVINVVLFTLQFFCVYFFVQITRTYSQFYLQGRKSSLDRLADSISQTVQLCPMLGVLYVGVRLRALNLNPVGAPPGWAQMWMYICNFAVLGQTLLGIVIHFSIGNEARAIGIVGWVLTAVKFIIMIGIYVGFSVIIVAFFLMESPAGNANCPTCTFVYTPPVPPAIQCLIALTIQYFALYLVLYVIHQYNALTRRGFKTPLEHTVDNARDSVKFCPILAVLFVGARMRALELDPAGAPQPWAQDAFFVCTYAVLAQTLLRLFLPFFTGQSNARTDSEGRPLTRGRAPGTMAFAVSMLQYASLMALYVATLMVIYSVMTIEAPHGKETPPVSTAMRCVITFTMLFIVVYFLQAVVKTYTAIFLNAVGQMTNAEKILNQAVPTLDLVPMMCILFVACRMRALQIHPHGESQPWAATMMRVATLSLIVQLLISLSIPFFTRELEDDHDEDGQVQRDSQHLRMSERTSIQGTAISARAQQTVVPRQPFRPVGPVAGWLTILKYCAVVSVNVCSCAIVASIFLITAS